MENSQGLPSWNNGLESACRCRGHRFDPWPRKIPHAAERLSQCATSTEPALGAHESQLLKAVHPDPALRNNRRHRKKPDRAAESSPVYGNERRPARSNEDPVQTEKEKNEKKYLSYNIKKQTYHLKRRAGLDCAVYWPFLKFIVLSRIIARRVSHTQLVG